MEPTNRGILKLKNGKSFSGVNIGYPRNVSGEVVFSTGMTGYVESITDPSYFGQILLFTYPMLGNYGVPSKEFWESGKAQTEGIVLQSAVNSVYEKANKTGFIDFLYEQQVPALLIEDTRKLTIQLRNLGTIPGKLWCGKKSKYNFIKGSTSAVSIVSTKERLIHNPKGANRIGLIDCGVKHNIIRELTKRNCCVMQVPYNYDLTNEKIDAVVISNGPGDPKVIPQTIINIQKLLKKNIPILGICLGNQLLALAAGGDTKKLKFGHRSQNQPCRFEDKQNSYFITTQNHGYVVSKIPDGFLPWFTNANDGTNEGIRHKNKPIMSVQFHPEACPGPTDTEWVFDYFLNAIRMTKMSHIRMIRINK
jgi:carbamoyl-phosphate synthase small subunit